MRNFKKLIVLSSLGIAVAGTGLTGCEQLHEREARQTGRSSAQYVTDQSTDNRVKDALHNSPVYKFPGVGVQTFDGVVQLNGFVEAPDQKRAAEDIAKNVPGVQRIVNNIAITSEVSPTGRGNGVYRAPIYESQPQPVQGNQPPANQPPPQP